MFSEKRFLSIRERLRFCDLLVIFYIDKGWCSYMYEARWNLLKEIIFCRDLDLRFLTLSQICDTPSYHG